MLVQAASPHLEAIQNDYLEQSSPKVGFGRSESADSVLIRPWARRVHPLADRRMPQAVVILVANTQSG